MADSVVVTGIGLVTPLGDTADRVRDRIGRGESASLTPPFHSPALACPLYAPIRDFDVQRHFPGNKTLRLMNRDAHLAVVAARAAMQDAGIVAGRTYPCEQVALYGATGFVDLPLTDVAGLVRHAAAADGSLDLRRFGSVGLKRVRPVLSFKLLANMPICFVSIFEQIRGENAVYTPWEGQGAQAIAAGIRAIRRGRVPCALVGGCDVKTHELALVSLQQSGAFESWLRHGRGCIPGEGSAFVVLENEQRAAARGARVHARIVDSRIGIIGGDRTLDDVCSTVIGSLAVGDQTGLVAASDGDVSIGDAEQSALEKANIRVSHVVRPKQHMGNLFAAAAAVQVALAADMASGGEAGRRVLADCFGHGDEQAAFVLESV